MRTEQNFEAKGKQYMQGFVDLKHRWTGRVLAAEVSM